MKMNNKGYASTIIMFSVLALFLVSMLVLVKTMNNSSTLNKSIKSNVIDEINYGDSTSLKQQVAQLTEDVKALQKYKDEQVDPMITALNTSEFTSVNVVLSSTTILTGGYKQIGKLVIVNLNVIDSQKFNNPSASQENAKLSKNTNSPTPILKDLPIPATPTPLSTITYYCPAPGQCDVNYMFGIVNSLGQIAISENSSPEYVSGWGIRIVGTYIAK